MRLADLIERDAARLAEMALGAPSTDRWTVRPWSHAAFARGKLGFFAQVLPICAVRIVHERSE
jgi:hypothetical protein